MGGFVFTPDFWKFKNSVFGTPEGIAKAAPLATAGIPRDQFLYDISIKRVIPHRGLWPVGTLAGGQPVSTFDAMKRSVDLLRADLTHAQNTEPVAPDDRQVPSWRIDLLDRAIQKVFYSDPPIPYETQRKDATGSRFEIELKWDTDAAGKPSKLHLTILCPAGH